MLLTVTTTMPDATDLGYLLHKHPGRVQRFDVYGGVAHVFYPEATPERTTAALMLEVDPIGLARGKGKLREGFALGQYVNDRPYASSSLLSVAMGKVFRTALNGRCDDRQALADTAIPLDIELPSVRCKEAGGRARSEGADLAERLFGPLGWSVDSRSVPLDPELPEWGDSAYAHLRLSGTARLADALNHLYVLLPVLDDAKHYWVGDDEVDKLVRAGGSWLAGHPERELIAKRYLAHQGRLWHPALERLADVDDVVYDERPAATPLFRARHEAVVAELRRSGAQRVVDLGCGSGALLEALLTERGITELVGADVSAYALERAARRLHVEQMTERQRDRLTLMQTSLTYRDDRLAGYDAVVLMEVIEHLDPALLPSAEQNVFAAAAPATVLVTTPNADYNAAYEGLANGTLRHHDHRFEWGREEFAAWVERICDTHAYAARIEGIGDVDERLGAPTQLAVFTRKDAS
ncbi:3' terminal RNA ribose 2'-O-methyltransferase Hen1 [Solicola gregarius]|uniref:Small RNA 2'-O-methyltransferase n=1 Tax=Solicola gregarius TaxID=2908642 RepID=A0AA46YL38_9ACTN|nr:3' terminal RNA ribose 2'-O-methyltransferase Hen1 [Solicola gregarius]UYM06162.1 3' terminal RNA ribose 2'-O-methyltransferase Hen1 [Solicola gregarius]